MESGPGAVHLDEIGQIALTVDNQQAAKTFYRDVLGMKFLFDAGPMTFFQCGNIRLLLGPSERPAGTSGTILYFRVPDMQVAHAALKEKAVEFVQEPHLVARMKTHDLWLALLKDPAGNTLALMEEKAREE